MTEREAIVAWLREQSSAIYKMASETSNNELKMLWHRDAAIAMQFAKALQAGQHLENKDG